MTAIDEPKINNVSTLMVDVTPEQATRWLARNRRNRNLRRNLVDNYARDMTRGDWRFTGEAIKISVEEELLDGQHRLAAVVKAQVTVRMLVVFGLPADAQEVMDTGAKRTPADALRLRGQVNGTMLASTARMILTEGAKFNTRHTTAELLYVVDTDPSLLWVVNTGLAGLSGLKRVLTPAVLGYTYWRLHQVDTWACAEFYSRLDSLNDLSKGSPILALHRRLVTTDRRGDGQAHRREAVAYVFIAWNAWRRNENRTIIKPAVVNGQITVPDPI